MKYSYLRLKLNRNLQEIRCYSIFGLLIIFPVYLCINVLNEYRFLFHPILFFIGWFTWTFVEYIMHRFWTHSKNKDRLKFVIQRHLHHHTHPSDIKVTGSQRTTLVALSLSLVAISIMLDNYFTLVAGFGTGIALFFLIHYFLHQKWAKKVFPNLLKAHIVHHCKNPDRCFCFSLTLWDRIFNTGIPKSIIISERVIEFYFGNHHN